jgi:hypothetical protein
MIRHEAIRVNRAVVPFRQLAEVREVHEVIAVVLETVNPVVAALNDVNRDTGQEKPRGPGHSRNNAGSGARLTD